MRVPPPALTAQSQAPAAVTLHTNTSLVLELAACRLVSTVVPNVAVAVGKEPVRYTVPAASTAKALQRCSPGPPPVEGPLVHPGGVALGHYHFRVGAGEAEGAEMHRTQGAGLEGIALRVGVFGQLPEGAAARRSQRRQHGGLVDDQLRGLGLGRARESYS